MNDYTLQDLIAAWKKHADRFDESNKDRCWEDEEMYFNLPRALLTLALEIQALKEKEK
jgi:hypothetical protein